jgi:hypothetical protein
VLGEARVRVERVEVVHTAHAARWAQRVHITSFLVLLCREGIGVAAALDVLLQQTWGESRGVRKSAHAFLRIVSQTATLTPPPHTHTSSHPRPHTNPRTPSHFPHSPHLEGRHPPPAFMQQCNLRDSHALERNQQHEEERHASDLRASRGHGHMGA